MAKRSFLEKLINIIYNPVLYKELNIGFRDRRIFVIQTLYLTILTIALFVVLIESLRYYNYNAADVGKSIFYTLFTIQFLLVLVIAPSLTCGSISTEKEKKTYELLVNTLLTPSEIISGKLIYGLSHIFLLLVSSLPLTATVFFLGGISPVQLILGYLVIFATGFICCQIGEFFSVRETKTSNATNQSYLMIILFAIGFMPVLLGLINYYQSASTSPLTYKTLHFPIWLFFGINFIAFAGFLFAKTVNYISHQAKNIIYMCKFFLLGYTFNLTIFSAVIANENPAKEEIGFVFTLIIITNLFVLGFFGSPSTFSSNRELNLFNRSLFSHSYFFPLFLAITMIIPVTFFAFELLQEDLSPLLKTFYLNTFYILVFYVASRALFRIFRERFPLAFFYYLLLITLSFLPYLSFLIITLPTQVVPFTSFLFLSPTITTYSLWSIANTSYPKELDFFAQKIPLSIFSILAYLFMLLLFVIIYKNFVKESHLKESAISD